MSICKIFLRSFIIISFSLSIVASSEEQEKKDAIALAKKAVEAFKTYKEEDLFAEISKKGSLYRKGELYVFIIDFKGKVRAHLKPIVGKNLISLSDQEGKLFATEFIKIAKDKGYGWVSYLWPKPSDGKVYRKHTYIERVAGKNYFVGVGYYTGAPY